MSKTKEIHFFDLRNQESYFLPVILNASLQEKVNYIAKRLDLTDYAKHFGGSERFPCVGEITPCYMFFDWVPGVMARVFGEEMRYIILIRDPVARSFSHYWHEIYKCREYLPLRRALYSEEQRIQRSFYDYRRFSYVARSRYAVQIKRFLEVIPRDRILIMFLEDLNRNTEQCFARICDFLNTPYYPVNFDQDRYHLDMPKSLWLTRALRRIELIFKDRRMIWRVGRLIHNLNRRLPRREGPYPRIHGEVRDWLVKEFEGLNHELFDLLEVKLSTKWQYLQ